MDSGPILDLPWPADLDPASVPFKTRTETVLRRAGYYDDAQRFNTLTEDEVMGWWSPFRLAGPLAGRVSVVAVADIRFAGDRAIRRHHEDTDQRSEMNVALAAVAVEPWAPHIWHRDPRFASYVPKSNDTVHDVAADGHPDLRRSLWARLDGLRAAVATQAALTLPDASGATISTLPESESGAWVIGVEPPDFDQIVEADGGIEACRAWAEWNNDYDQTMSCEIAGGEMRVAEVDVDCPISQALSDMADCVTVGWTNLDTYLQCIDDARETATTTTEPGIIDRTHRIFRVFIADSQRRLRLTTS